MSAKGSYHRRKSHNKPVVIPVPNIRPKYTHLQIERVMLIDLLQVAYELGYKDDRSKGMMPNYGEKMVEKIIGET